MTGVQTCALPISGTDLRDNTAQRLLSRWQVGRLRGALEVYRLERGSYPERLPELVEAGLGVSVLPATAAERLARLFAVRVLALDEPWAAREYLLGVRAQEVLPAVLQRFVDALCPPDPTPVSPAGGRKP